MKRKKGIIAALTVVLLLTMFGYVYAFMYKSSVTVSNDFIPADVECRVVETVEGNTKTSIRVENVDADNHIEAYLRVKLVSYWVDSNGDVVAKSSEMPAFSLADGWLQGHDNTFYYTKIVKPGSFTGNLLKDTITLKEDNGCYQVLDVFAEAIQAYPAEAVQNTWHVTVNGSNEIIQIN